LFAGWVNRRQLAVIDYLKTENRILHEHLQGRLWVANNRSHVS
jgi:hypothetical protein